MLMLPSRVLLVVGALVMTDGGGGRGGWGRGTRGSSMAMAQSHSHTTTTTTTDEEHTEEVLRKVMVHPKDATMYLGALIPFHDKIRDMKTGKDLCTYLQLAQHCTQQSLGFIKGFFAGQNQYHDKDLTCGDGTLPVYSGTKFDKVVGVIGGQRSSVSVEIATVLRVIQLPQISYLSTSSSLDNRDRYPFFLRTVPSDVTQAQVILRLMSEFGLTHADLVYSAEDYGEGGHRELTRSAHRYNVCFATPAHQLAAHDPDDAYQKVVEHLTREGEFKVVVVFAIRKVAVRLLKTVELSNNHDKFLWLGSDAWTYDTLQELAFAAEGALAIQPLAKTIPGFNEHFASLRSAPDSRNPWFSEYWRHRDDAQLLNHRIRPGGRSLQSDPQANQMNFTKPYLHEPWLHFVRDAVMSFAHALHAMWEAECEGQPGSCEAMAHGGHLHGHHLLQYLQNVSFTDMSDETFRFDPKGSGPAKYTIFSFQRMQDNTHAWVPVGNYSNTTGHTPQFYLDSTLIKHKHRRGKSFPELSCRRKCEPGQEKILLPYSCCWTCKDCQPLQYYNTSEHSCVDCPECTLPDGARKGCIAKEVKSIDYRSRWAITSLAFASLGIFSTVLVGIIFWVHLDTPVIKAASRELSYILLGGILLSFLMSFIIVAPPNALSCGLTRFFLGFSYTLCYAAVLTKTSRISRIFNNHYSKKSYKARYTSPWSQVVIVVILVSVEIVINVLWLALNPPTTKTLCSHTVHYQVRICTGLHDYSYIVGLIYPLILVAICTIYAIKTRKCPGGFNEAKYITFTNYTTCIIWLIFVPLYLSTGVTSDIRVVTLALSLSLGGFVQLGCLFFPKVHVVLFKPEKNTRDAVMSVMRHSACNGDTDHRRYGPNHHSAPAVFALGGTVHQIAGAPASVVLSTTLPHPGPRESPGRVNQVYMSTVQSKQDMNCL
ncbi:Metabotropic glutamate receptor 3 [Chionoecetes opilio]|uniref:Metabotropic glutamate receptor 3 n=1 Tax=Chionoecetes opilio TaxID=41210 RepID=A0A8J5CGL4_CHIOP|nr:Metabotropic glutamate receptor 3 [Chionoecetes opilio]